MADGSGAVSTGELGEITEQDVETAVYEVLRDHDRVSEIYISMMCPEWLKPQRFRLIVWQARRRLLNEGITTACKDGWIYRTNARQTETRAKSHARAAYRKMGTVVTTLYNAAAQADDPEDKRRLEAQALRRANAIVDAKSAARGAVRSRPRGI